MAKNKDLVELESSTAVEICPISNDKPAEKAPTPKQAEKDAKAKDAKASCSAKKEPSKKDGDKALSPEDLDAANGGRIKDKGRQKPFF